MINQKLNSKRLEEKNVIESSQKSPYQLWQEENCKHCKWKCNPSENRFMTCVSCDLTSAIQDVAHTLQKILEQSSEVQK